MRDGKGSRKGGEKSMCARACVCAKSTFRVVYTFVFVEIWFLLSVVSSEGYEFRLPECLTRSSIIKMAVDLLYIFIYFGEF